MCITIYDLIEIIANEEVSAIHNTICILFDHH